MFQNTLLCFGIFHVMFQPENMPLLYGGFCKNTNLVKRVLQILRV